ncbi:MULTISPECIES: carbohydrate ABC transporter permease [Phyllobacteriaceae]|uniref:Sugar ABC transporter permease n=1 Tax=Mesorhizobium hungaricum TaxID=1566387 RepID=A0A1C2E8Z5_9HYPH|nr:MULTISPECIES: carbohydrate ABC transporter permease [Mesorhizobium]MBN9236586.1 carbohydrate ABC transporter permease [Mesorhizobium sp.]MDQ0329256.1 trehalose/maltose transport system permease protein [Mesorhizobium sp. YL-MeA3-2017]OCX23460.1 sugar ABC transporter permease [Mesorhizobium hungaricum]
MASTTATARRRSSTRYRWQRRARSAGLVMLSLLVLAYTLFPYYWAIVSSFRSGSELFSTSLVPSFDLAHYKALLADPVFTGSIINSLIVAGSTTVISLALAVAAAYALGRLNFSGRQAMLMAILVVSIFPQIAVMSGMFELVRWLGLYNRVGALILAYLIFTVPFTVWVLTSFMREFPRELEEAAIMDGCSHWRILTRILLPLMGPALASTGLLAFILAWNEFLFALTFILSDENRTVPVAIGLISGNSRYEYPFGPVMAASIIVTLPLLVLVLIFQRRIVSGLTAGAIKG